MYYLKWKLWRLQFTSQFTRELMRISLLWSSISIWFQSILHYKLTSLNLSWIYFFTNHFSRNKRLPSIGKWIHAFFNIIIENKCFKKYFSRIYTSKSIWYLFLLNFTRLIWDSISLCKLQTWRTNQLQEGPFTILLLPVSPRFVLFNFYYRKACKNSGSNLFMHSVILT